MRIYPLFRKVEQNIGFIFRIVYTLEDLKWDKFDNVPAINMELDTTNVKPFIIINSRDIFLFSKNDLFINPNDIDIK